MPMPLDARARGSTSIRTAYFCEPITFTWATPLIIDRRCAMVDCAYSSSVDSGSVSDSSTRIVTGKSVGLTFWYEGGDGICGGSDRAVRAICDCTSCAAASMLRDRSNCRVMLVEPWTLLELIDVTPAIVANCFSSGSATADAIVSGLAPGRLALTWSVGKSTFGRSATGSTR